MEKTLVVVLVAQNKKGENLEVRIAPDGEGSKVRIFIGTLVDEYPEKGKKTYFDSGDIHIRRESGDADKTVTEKVTTIHRGQYVRFWWE